MQRYPKTGTARRRTSGKAATSYIVRNIPNGLWGKAKAKAWSEGRTMSWIIIKLLRLWVEEEIKL